MFYHPERDLTIIVYVDHGRMSEGWWDGVPEELMDDKKISIGSLLNFRDDSKPHQSHG
jgi:hypothetical protein